MKLSDLTNTEQSILNLLNQSKKNPIQWDKMPKQEVLTHLYGWDNPHVNIKKLLTPREKSLLRENGYLINNELKNNTQLLIETRRKRKRP